jgi:triosephosphate isomerase
MRIPIIAGNWKMNKTVAEAVALVHELGPALQGIAGVEKVVCPSFVALAALAPVTAQYGIGLGAQDVFWEVSGAYTGEVSVAMLAEVCRYVIIGHSERRQYFGETDESVNRKLKAALAGGLQPIVCVGEVLAQYEAGQTAAVVGGQVRGAFAGLSAEQARGVVIAYEPVWAIGTGKAATGPGANAVIAESIRGTLAGLYGADVAQAVRVQYGGSVNAANSAEFMRQPDIDGALVGGASLKPKDFVAIVQAGK